MPSAQTSFCLLRLPHLNIYICPFGRPNKPAIKGQESFTAPSGCQMHGIGKIHTVFRMAQSLRSKGLDFQPLRWTIPRKLAARGLH